MGTPALNGFSASGYYGKGAGILSGNSAPVPGTAAASISETARMEIMIASTGSSLVAGIQTGYEKGSSSVAIRTALSTRSILTNSWGF